MPMSETVAAAAVKAALVAGDYGGTLTPEAQALVNKVGDAVAKCVAHMIANNSVSVDVTGAVTGATPAAPGVFAGTGTGTVGGLTRGSAAANTGLAGEIVTELLTGDYGGTITAAARVQLDVIADALAGFADYVETNAVVSTTDVGAGTTNNLNGATTGDGTGSAA